MTIADILAESKTFNLAFFPPTTIANVEKRFEAANEKTGKPAIRCLVRDKFVAATGLTPKVGEIKNIVPRG